MRKIKINRNIHNLKKLSKTKAKNKKDKQNKRRSKAKLYYFLYSSMAQSLLELQLS